jgi:hypothetical protein
MDGMQRGIARDGNGRFLSGCSGNPTGKKPGTRNRATVLRELLDEGEDKTLARLVIDRALAGDVVTARFLLGRLEPKPRGRPIELDLPEEVASGAAALAAYDSTLRQLADGEITPEEALDILRFLEGRGRVRRAWQGEKTPAQTEIPQDDSLSPPAKSRHVSLPPATPPHISSPPAARGERDAQGWRAEGEPYPELGEGGVSTREVSGGPIAAPAVRASTPHPAPAKLDVVSLSLCNPLPQGERGNRAVAMGTMTSRMALHSSSPLHSTCISTSWSGRVAGLKPAPGSALLADPCRPRY